MKKLSIAFGLTILITCYPALAQNKGKTSSNKLEHHYSIGFGGIGMPKYEGSEKYEAKPFPILEYSNQYFFISTTKGLGANLINTETFTAGPLVYYRFGRKEKDSDRLKGLGDVDGGAEAGAFIDWKFHKNFSAEFKVMHGIDKAKGLTADISLNYQQPITPDLTFLASVSTMYADSKYNEQYFGITHEQSYRSKYKQYDAGSGIKHISLRPGLQYTYSQNCLIQAFYEYKRLTDGAADSPIVKDGSKNQNYFGAFVSWQY